MRALTTLLATLAVAAPAAAQDGSEGAAQRTPESAQRFLAEFYGQGGLNAFIQMKVKDGGYAPILIGESVPNLPSGKWGWSPLSAKVAGWTRTDRCRTRIDLTGARAVWQESGAFDLPAQSVAAEIDWSRIIAVHISPEAAQSPVRSSDGSLGQSMFFSVTPQGRHGDPGPPSLVFDTKEEADRVGFALDFLRRECELKSDTGF